MTLYEDLGLPPDATDADIKAAHRAHARKTHPDNGGSMDEFTRGQKAYEVLIDPRRRQRYDETGAEGVHDPEAAEKAQVLETLTQAVMYFVNGDTELEFNDIASMAAQNIRSAIDEDVRRKANLEAALSRIKTAAKRFKLKEQDDLDMIAALLKAREADLLRQMEQCDQTVQVKSKALDMLDTYNYDVDARPGVGGLDYDAVVALVKRTSGLPK